ncbi:MAG: MFS transporter [Candidatus Puniceispirillaceae bacterium]|jgi:MFS family permease
MNLLALKSLSFRRYLFSLHIALNGFWAQRVIIGWLAWVLTGSPSFVGFVAFLNFVPTLFVSPLFGVVADRIDVRIGSIISYSCAGVLSAILAWICLADALMPPLLAGFSLLTGVISSANHPMRMSLTPRLAPAEHLPSVVALTALNFNLSRLIGPAAGGALIHAIGAPHALVLTAASYAAPVLALCFMRPRERSRDAVPRRGSYVGELLDGWRYALQRRLVRSAIIFTGIGALAGRSVLETLPVLANGVFERGPAGLGFMTAAAGAGAAGAAIFKAMSQAQKPGVFQTHVLSMLLLVPLLVAGLSQVASFAAAVTIVLLLGGCVTLLAISLQSLVQMAIDDHFRGRVMGLWTTVSIGSGAGGAVTMGLLIDRIGIAPAQATIGLVLTGLSVVMILRFSTGK